MPSLFNQNNECWNEKSSPVVGFVQSDFHCEREAPQTEKLNDKFGSPSKLFSGVSNNSVQFCVSSNCYYGYQPHNFIGTLNKSACQNENAMDIDEINVSHTEASDSSTRSPWYTEVIGTPTLLESQMSKPARKRQSAMPQDRLNDHHKKMRQEEAAEPQVEENAVMQDTKLRGVGVSRAEILKNWTSEVHTNETTGELLKHIHGCDIYLYDRDCDY